MREIDKKEIDRVTTVLPQEGQELDPLDPKTIFFNPEFKIRGIHKIFSVGPAIIAKEESAFLVPGRTLKALRDSGIPFNQLEPSK